jgi:hypothetical protein
VRDRRALELTLQPIVAGITALLVMIGLLGTATHDPRPHDIPVGLSGPAPVVQQLVQAFGAAAPGAFRFTTYESDAAARAAIDQRAIIGALVVTQAGPRLIVAGAAGDAVTGGVTAAFTNAFRAQGTTLAVEVVHPFQSGDAHGIALFFLVLATLVSSVLAAAVMALRTQGAWTAQLTSIAAYAGLAGICGTLATAAIVGGYGDRLWQVMAISALFSLTVAAVAVACARLLGPAGVALAVLVVVLLGLVSSGGPLGSELLPDAYRAIAPWLPVGPTYSALRGALYFDGAGVAGPVALLGIWTGVAVVVMVLTATSRSSRQRTAMAHA